LSDEQVNEHRYFTKNETLDFSPKSYLPTLILLFVLVLLSAYFFRSLYLAQQKFIHAQENRYNSYLLTTQLRRSSDNLTRLVRTYAATGNPMFEKQFWEVLSIRNGLSPLPVLYDRVYWDFLAVKNGTPPFTSGSNRSLKSLMEAAGFTEEEFSLLEKSQNNSDKLVDLEKIAMNAMKGKYLNDDGEFSIVGTPNQQMAIDLLHSNEYHSAKISIMTPVNQFYEKLDQRTKKITKQSAKQLDFTLNILLFIFVISVSVIFFLILTAKNYHEGMVKKLNQRVDERTDELNSTNHELQKAIEEIKTLKDILPICSYCKKIRDDEGSWKQIEAYISSHSDAEFSHGICPDCLKKVRKDAGFEIGKQ